MEGLMTLCCCQREHPNVQENSWRRVTHPVSCYYVCFSLIRVYLMLSEEVVLWSLQCKAMSQDRRSRDPCGESGERWSLSQGSHRVFFHSVLLEVEAGVLSPPSPPLLGRSSRLPCLPNSTLLKEQVCSHPNMVEINLFYSWQLSHCGMSACQQGYVWNGNWIFHFH